MPCYRCYVRIPFRNPLTFESGTKYILNSILPVLAQVCHADWLNIWYRTTLKLLFRNDANINAKDASKSTALKPAINNGDWTALCALELVELKRPLEISHRSIGSNQPSTIFHGRGSTEQVQFTVLQLY